METIIVPTDFSKVSINAARYAVQFASKFNAEIVLLNVFTIPLESYDIPLAIVPGMDLRDICVPQLEKLADKLNKNNPANVQIKIAAIKGSPGEAIIEYAETHKTGMIIMGTHGESPAITRLFGNTTSYVLRESKIPVLTVPGHARYREIKNILITCDKAKSFTDPIIYTLQNISHTFGAKLNLIKVYNLAESMIYGTTVEGVNKIQQKLADVPQEYNYQIMAEAAGGINKAAKKYQADLVVLIAHKHDLITRLFKGSTTKQVIDTAKKPILVLPEKLTQKQSAHIFEAEKILPASE